MTIPFLAVMMVVNLATFDMTGVWTFNMKDFSGSPRSFDCTFKQEGTKLSGVCGEEAVKIAGAIKDRKVTFQHQTGTQNEITADYSGELNQAATELKGSWRVVNPDDGKAMSGDFTAVKR